MQPGHHAALLHGPSMVLALAQSGSRGCGGGLQADTLLPCCLARMSFLSGACASHTLHGAVQAQHTLRASAAHRMCTANTDRLCRCGAPEAPLHAFMTNASHISCVELHCCLRRQSIWRPAAWQHTLFCRVMAHCRY